MPSRYTEQANPVEAVENISACAFSVKEIRPFTFQARVVLKPLVSIIGRLVACSARISVNTHRQTDKATFSAYARTRAED